MRGEPREVWKERVGRWVRGGLTAEEFAQEEGVRPATLRHWKWQLRADGRGRREGRRREAKFVEIVTPQRTERGEGEGFEVQLGNGTRVRIPQLFDGDGLRRLLEILEGRGE
jgi:transposase-like protein